MEKHSWDDHGHLQQGWTAMKSDRTECLSWPANLTFPSSSNPGVCKPQPMSQKTSKICFYRAYELRMVFMFLKDYGGQGEQGENSTTWPAKPKISTISI